MEETLATLIQLFTALKQWIVTNLFVEKFTPDTGTVTLTPNKFYDFGEVQSLTITLGTPHAGRLNEYMFQFTSGSTPTTLADIAGVRWMNDDPLVPESNTVYQVSITEGLAVYTGWEAVTE